MKEGLLQHYAPPLQVYNSPCQRIRGRFRGKVATINFLERLWEKR